LIRALVFDFDGLILDTETVEYEVWREVYESHGQELPLPLWMAGVGTRDGFDPYAHLETLTGKPVDEGALRARKNERVKELMKEQQLLPGVGEYLGSAAGLGLRVGLASSAGRLWLDMFIGPRGLSQYFNAIRCGDDVARAKPDPEVYLRVLQDIGVRPSEAVAFEDSSPGLAAAKAAGLRCVVVPNHMTRGMDFRQADLVVGSLAHLPLAQLVRDYGGPPAGPGPEAPVR
jgi:HAD superfamily hydrolase (TIGR01509 family)